MNRIATGFDTFYPEIDCHALYKNHPPDLIRNLAGTQYFSTKWYHAPKAHAKNGKIPLDGVLRCFCGRQYHKDPVKFDHGK